MPAEVNYVASLVTKLSDWQQITEIYGKYKCLEFATTQYNVGNHKNYYRVTSYIIS